MGGEPGRTREARGEAGSVAQGEEEEGLTAGRAPCEPAAESSSAGTTSSSSLGRTSEPAEERIWEGLRGEERGEGRPGEKGAAKLGFRV